MHMGPPLKKELLTRKKKNKETVIIQGRRRRGILRIPGSNKIEALISPRPEAPQSGLRIPGRP